MYFPYLRGKQQELLALLDVMVVLKKSRVLPIIEPVGEGPSVIKSLKTITDSKIPIIFIVNPQDGIYKDNSKKMKTLFELVSPNGNVIPAFIIAPGTTLNDIELFFMEYESRQKSLIHLVDIGQITQLVTLCRKQKNFAHHIFIVGKTSDTYNDHFDLFQRVILEDGYNREGAKKNADRADDIFFSELHSTYKKKKYNGFGDFTIAGLKYSEKGGAAHAVSIALTYHNKLSLTDEIRIKNFVSDRKTGVSDIAGKYLEAVKKLSLFCRQKPSIAYKSFGVHKFLDSYDKKEFHGLGSIKRWSISHHIELITSL